MWMDSDSSDDSFLFPLFCLNLTLALSPTAYLLLLAAAAAPLALLVLSSPVASSDLNPLSPSDVVMMSVNQGWIGGRRCICFTISGDSCDLLLYQPESLGSSCLTLSYPDAEALPTVLLQNLLTSLDMLPGLFFLFLLSLSLSQPK